MREELAALLQVRGQPLTTSDTERVRTLEMEDQLRIKSADTCDEDPSELSTVERDIDGLNTVLNGNALIAALFITVEVPLLTMPSKDFEDWRRRVVLYSAVLSVLLHSITVFIAAETCFVLGNVSKLRPSRRAIELTRFRNTRLGALVEPASGWTYIWGIVLGMIAQGFRLAPSYGIVDGEIAGVLLTVAFLCMGTYAWSGVGGYVGRMHQRAAADDADGRAMTRDNRGRRPTRSKPGADEGEPEGAHQVSA